LTEKRLPDLNGITKFFYMLLRLLLQVTGLQQHLIYFPTLTYMVKATKYTQAHVWRWTHSHTHNYDIWMSKE